LKHQKYVIDRGDALEKYLMEFNPITTFKFESFDVIYVLVYVNIQIYKP